MSAARPWSVPSSYAAFRATAWAKALARRVIDTGVGILPGPAFRLAAYVQALERARALRDVKVAAQAETPCARFEELLGNAGDSLDHQAVLRMLKASGDLTEAAYHRYLASAFIARRLDLIDKTLRDGGHGFAETDLFHRLQLQQYRGDVTLTAAEIVAAYRSLAGNALHRDGAGNLAADLLARLGDVANLAAFLDSLPPEHLTRLSAPTFFGVARLLAAASSGGIAPWLRRAYLDALAIEQRLFFLEVLPQRDQTRLLGAKLTAPAVIDRFRAVYSAADQRDRANVERCVIAPLQRLCGSETSLMNIRFDQAERVALQAKITGALVARRALGLVRLGDGEAYGHDHSGLDIAPEAAFHEDNDTRERMWWGRTVTEEARDQIRRRFRAAVAEADIIGVPSVYRMIRDRGPAGSAFGLTGGQRGLAVILAKLGTDIPVADRIITEERCHQVLFTREPLEALCAKAGQVVLVSCWRAEQVALQAPVPMHGIVIPGHTRVAKTTGLASGAPPLCETFDDQVAAMASLCGPGVLVLVGAGFLGKLFVAAARARGAVALDVGAMLDYMAGHKTRSLADMG